MAGRVSVVRPREAWPAGIQVDLTAEARLLDGGRLILGGRPVRARRLSGRGRDVVSGWLGGATVGASPAQQSLARRLLEDGVLAPRPAAVDDLSCLSIVVPVRDRPEQLRRCLESVRLSCPVSPVVVVDDGSADPGRVAAVCAEGGARVVRHERSAGAAGARNAGLRVCATPLVAFVDSDVVLPADWAQRLVGHFADPRLGAVAPRVLALAPIRGGIGGYEARHSPLDMGTRPGLVGPGRPTPYVPTATLVVRRDAAEGGFDPGMTIGEDVDLVWRIDAAGWTVRYAPDTHVWHDHRIRLREFVSRRRTYAASIAPLAKRHPGALPAARLNSQMVLPWALLFGGRPRVAAALALVSAIRLASRLQAVSDRPHRVAGGIVAQGLGRTGHGLARAARRSWAPLLLPAAMRSRRARRLLAAAFLAPVLQDAAAARDVRALPGDAVLRMVDEVVALWGALEGCARERTTIPLRVTWETAARR